MADYSHHLCCEKKSRKQAIAFTDNTDVSMYSSPAYGTHQVFTEPGLDHLYEPIDELYEEKSTTLQDTVPPVDDDENDAEGYLKMKPSCEVDEAVPEGDVGSTFIGSKSTDEYVQAADDKDHLPTGNDEDDGYDNNDQK